MHFLKNLGERNELVYRGLFSHWSFCSGYVVFKHQPCDRTDYVLKNLESFDDHNHHVPQFLGSGNLLPLHREPNPEDFRDCFKLGAEFDLARIDSTFIETLHAYIPPEMLTPEVFVLSVNRITAWAVPRNGVSSFYYCSGPGSVTFAFTRQCDHINVPEYTASELILYLEFFFPRCGTQFFPNSQLHPGSDAHIALCSVTTH